MPQLPRSPYPPQHSAPGRYREVYEREPSSSIVTVAKIVYFLHGISILIGVCTGATIISAFLFGWPSICAVVLNYAMKSEARGTLVESHFRWQIRTFWVALAITVAVAIIGFFLAFVAVGLAVWMVGFLVLGIWVGYRILRGWILLAQGKPTPE